MKKGFINILELIFVLITLFIAFSVLFPGFSYRTKWTEAMLLWTGRDLILTADRIGNLYSYSFDSGQFFGFLDKTIPTNKTNLIGWSDTEGAVKSKITVACNCTEQQKDLLINWTRNLEINGRIIQFAFPITNLNVIQSSDVLLIWDYKDLTPYATQLWNYFNQGKGIVEMMDFSADPQAIQQQMFGITTGGSWGSPNADEIVKPATANNVTYQAYKIYLNGLKGQNLTIPEFCKEPSFKKIIPTGDISDRSRVLFRGNDTVDRNFCVILNGTKIATVAWIANFTDINYTSDHTKLLTALLLATSSKKPDRPNIPSNIGYITSYINVKNDDMFEVYRFNLGLGHPY